MAKHILIRKVWETGFGQKHITIPNENPEGIVSGDYVTIKRVKPRLVDGKCKICKKPYVKHTVEELHKHKLMEKVL